MKRVEAIIKPFKLDEVKESLGSIGVHTTAVSSSVHAAGKRRTLACRVAWCR